MSRSKDALNEFLRINRPPWQERIPTRLRIAAEWFFGVFPLTSLVLLFRAELIGAAVGMGVAVALFLFTAGWSPGRRINNPTLWWIWVISMTLLGFVAMIIGTFVEPPE